jgi:alpha-mannosidase
MNFFKVRRDSLKLKSICTITAIVCSMPLYTAYAQQKKAYFIDGYHGGIWGHYPVWNTRFMADMLKNNPQWKINIEIEPETWDDAKVKDSEAYKDFQDLLADQSATGMRIEYVNPGYAQSYTYNIQGESIIRQFKYGIKKVKEHFPSALFTTYSSEEPCFTSALPQILTSFGFKSASLKNPNTCWGGYTSAFGGELVNWVGPDGTKLVTIPRYATEKLLPGSTWQTNAFYNGADYVNDAFACGIEHPLGMTLQDAGWRNGLYLGKGNRSYQPTEYTTYRNYLENVAIKTPKQDWKFSQEDVLVSLVWGSQILQKLAQQVRVAENKIIMAEKIAAINNVYNKAKWPQAGFDEAWRTLLLSQHHDCWIVPYNGRNGNTWAAKVVKWTGTTNRVADSVINAGDKFGAVRVYNTLGFDRAGWVSIPAPKNIGKGIVTMMGNYGPRAVGQIVRDSANAVPRIVFWAVVPSMGYKTYYRYAEKITPKVKSKELRMVSKLSNGNYKIESNLYTIIINAAKGGTIESIVAKTLNNKEFVDKANERVFNELRGNFSKEGGFLSSKDKPAEVIVLEDGPYLAKLQIKGSIGMHKFIQTLTVMQAEKRIDLQVAINYNGNPEIGEPTAPGAYKSTDNHKGFYNDKEKLMALFPLNLKGQKVYKNAPYDVTESRLTNTFFTDWDKIKNNVLLNWVDVIDKDDAYGMALFTDHTTNYAHGEDFPLGLTLQYSGVGLWGRNYKIEGPTVVNYTLVPHAGKWDKAGLWTESDKWNEPMVAVAGEFAQMDKSRSLINIQGEGYEVSSVTVEGNDLLVRLFNAEGDEKERKLAFNFKAEKAEMIELNGNKKQDMYITKNGKGEAYVLVSAPRFGVRTIKFINYAKTN